MSEHLLARRIVFWVVAAAALAAVGMGIVDTVTADPAEGEGWIGGPIELVFAAGPLVAVAIGLRSTRPTTARRTAVAALLLAVAVAFVLVMQLLDENETVANRLIQGGALLVYLAAFTVELPAFTHKA